MNNYDNICDLLTYNKTYNVFYIIKNSRPVKNFSKFLDYYDATYSKYGVLIGLCAGKGLWMNMKYDYRRFDPWAFEGTSLFDDSVNSKKTDMLNNGWANTIYILNHYVGSLEETLWSYIHDQYIDGLGTGVAYLPAINELISICHNNDKLQLEYEDYWSSTQDHTYDDCALCVNFGTKKSGYECKENSLGCI